MDTPVSAFAMYSKNKKKPPPKKNKKRNKLITKSKHINGSSSKVNAQDIIPDSINIEAAKKIKRKQQKVKESKNINKKKSLKQPKSNGGKNGKILLDKKPKKIRIDSDDDIPELISAPLAISNNNHTENDDAHSNSSNGSFEFDPVLTDSTEEGLKVFKWMIAPYDHDQFLAKVWEKKPLHIARNNPAYFKGIISTPIIDNMLRNENIQYTKNIDVTSYVDGKRSTHSAEGRAHPHLVWDSYLHGCSIRLLNPQTYIPKLHLVNATMQEFFNSFVGANAYLTPPDSQGFAPHYDDIEAFILQAEGKKLWRIYKPRMEGEVLPRFSSKNFDQDEIGDPIMEVTLVAGDMLYFPRGFIHQGVTIDGEHSLHVTISMYQKHAFADLFEKMIPAALQMAINENVEFRKGLPLDIYDNFGLVNSDVNTPRRKEITGLIESLFDKIKNHLPIDDAVDQMNKNYQEDALPPVLTDLEKAVTVFGDNDVMVDNGKVINRVEIGLDTKIRLLRKNILRLVSEDSIRLYYHVENSLEYHGNALPYLEIESDLAPAIETLITSYPHYVSVENLDIPDDSEKLQIADALWSRGLIMTEFPLENIDDD